MSYGRSPVAAGVGAGGRGGSPGIWGTNCDTLTGIKHFLLKYISTIVSDFPLYIVIGLVLPESTAHESTHGLVTQGSGDIGLVDSSRPHLACQMKQTSGRCCGPRSNPH